MVLAPTAPPRRPPVPSANAAPAEDDFDADDATPAATRPASAGRRALPPRSPSPPGGALPPPPPALPPPRRDLAWPEQAAAAADAGVTLPLLAHRDGAALLRQSDLFVPLAPARGAGARRAAGASRARARAARVAGAAAAGGASGDEADALRAAAAREGEGEGGGEGGGDGAPPSAAAAAAAAATAADSDYDELPALVAGEPADEPWPAPRARPPSPPRARGRPPPASPPRPPVDPADLLPASCFSNAVLVEWEAAVDWEGRQGDGDAASATAARAPPADLPPLSAPPGEARTRPSIHPLALRFDAPREKGAAPPAAPPAATTARAWPPSAVDWGGAGAPPRPPVRLLLDLNDARMAFELTTDKPPPSVAALAARAAAAVAPPPRGAAGPPLPPGLPPAAAALARLNVSADAAYAPRVARAARAAAAGPRHAAPAASLATLPPKVGAADLAHRPRGLFVPPVLKVSSSAAAAAAAATAAAAAAAAGDGPSSAPPPPPPATTATVRLASTVGACGRAALAQRFPGVPLATATGGELWAAAAAAKFSGGGGSGGGAPDAAAAPPPPRAVLWRRAPGAPPARLDAAAPLGAPPAPGTTVVELAVTLPAIEPLPTATAAALPPPASGAPTRPPGAFARRRDVTARGPGHVLLVEHMEECPAALGRPGMGTRLATVYRKAGPADAGAPRPGRGVPRWRLGAVEVLPRDAPCPFLLGSVPPGESVLSVDTGLARAPAAAHDPRASDFLLVRAPTGALALREITGALLVGQHEPLARVPPPRSRAAADIEEARAVAHAARELRKRAARVERGRARGPASVTIAELRDLFPGVPAPALRARLRDRLDCVPARGDDDEWTPRAGAALPVEGELRRLAPPDAWCLLEASRAGAARLRAAGVRADDRLADIPADRLRVAAESLPPLPGLAAAAAAVEAATVTAPWATTDAFVGVLREGGRGALAITGVADPTGRGRGYSFVRDLRRAVVDAPPGTSRRDAGAISGTGRDLRRLSMVQAKEVLVSLGVTPAEIDGLARWSRIGLIRELSSAAAVDGGELADRYGARYARVQRVGAAELADQRRRAAVAVWERQLRALASADPLPDDPPPRDPVPRREASTRVTTEDAASRAAAPATNAGEAAAVAGLVAAGFLAGGGAGGVADAAAAARPRLDAAPGDRRVRRVIKYTDPATGGPARRAVLFSDRDAVATLNAIHARGDASGAGFGRRVVRARKAGGGGRGVGRAGGGAAAPPPPLPRAAARAALNCTRCGGKGHTRKSRSCPAAGRGESDEERARAAADDDDEPVDPADLLPPARPRAPGPPRPRPKKAPPPPPPPPAPKPAAGLKLRISAGGRQLALVTSPSAPVGGVAGKLARRAAANKRQRPAQAGPDDGSESDGDDGGDPDASLSGGESDDESESDDGAGGASDGLDDEASPARKRKRASGGGGGASARPAGMTARKFLCARVLAPALAAAKRSTPSTCVDPFKKAVSKQAAPDYGAVVPASVAMDLDRVDRALKGGRYASAAAMRADVARIVHAARLYNEPRPETGLPAGRYGGVAIIGLAETLLAAVDAALDAVAFKIADAEAGVAAEDAARRR